MVASHRATSSRTGWIDGAKGVTVVLVVLLHAKLAVLTLPGAAPGPAFWSLMRFDNLLSWARMPVFFFCSGMVLTVAAARGWPQLLARRGEFTLRVILL